MAAIVGSLFAGTASAASFTVAGNSGSAQTLGSGSGQTGTVTATGNLTVSGSAVAVTISGNNATLTNLGTIKQTGTGRVVRDNTGVTGLVINNGSSTNATALMQAADADVIQMNKSPASVTLNNYGQMLSSNASAGGNQVVDFNAILSGSNTVNNFAGGLMKATEADAVRPGVNGVVNNWGTIQAVTPSHSSSDGIDAQTNSGIQVFNFGTGVIDGGRHGITGGAADASSTFTMQVTNNAGGVIRGNNGSGINIDGFNAKQLVTVTNGGLIQGNGVLGDGDGVDVDGLVNLTNTGTIRSLNAFSPAGSGLAFSEGMSVGGGTITNSGVIEGLVANGNTNAVGRGITLVGNDITSGVNTGKRESLYGDAVVVNQAGGVIRGQGDAAIYAGGLSGSGKTVSITNEAGATLVGGNASFAAIVVASDYTTVIHNAGVIDGSAGGKAIQLGSGNSQVVISGGQAQVLGDIAGGGAASRISIDPGAGKAFAYAGSISNIGQLSVESGTVTLSGASSYAGATVLNGGTLVLDGANRLSADTALVLHGGALELDNAAGLNGQTFASLALTGSSKLLLNGSALSFGDIGDVIAGQTLVVLGYATSPGLDYAFRFVGDQSADADFKRLIGLTTINGVAARYHFDGSYTDVTPVPEPQTCALLIGGLLALAAATRRRRG